MSAIRTQYYHRSLVIQWQQDAHSTLAATADTFVNGIEILNEAERDAEVGSVVFDIQICTPILPAPQAAAALASAQTAHAIESGWQWQQALYNLLETVHTFPKPVVVALQGDIADAELALALASDAWVLERSSRILLRRAAAGLPPLGGLSWHARHTLPRMQALALLAGEPLDAMRAWQAGVVQRVASSGQVLDAALGLAECLAAAPAHTWQKTKHLIEQADQRLLHAQLQAELDLARMQR